MVKFHDFYLEVLSPKIPMGAWRSFIISKVNSQAKVGINGSAVQKARFFAIIKMFIFCIQTLNILDYKTFWKSFRCGGMEKRKSDKRLTDKYFITFNKFTKFLIPIHMYLVLILHSCFSQGPFLMNFWTIFVSFFAAAALSILDLYKIVTILKVHQELAPKLGANICSEKINLAVAGWSSENEICIRRSRETAKDGKSAKGIHFKRHIW